MDIACEPQPLLSGELERLTSIPVGDCECIMVGYSRPCALVHMRGGVEVDRCGSPRVFSVRPGDVIEVHTTRDNEGGDLFRAVVA
jgi:hypothetical protein